MNEVAIGTRPAVGGFHGLIRKVHKADFETVNRCGEPLVFETREAARAAAGDALCAYINGNLMRRDGAIIGKAKREAERVFAK
ncbi:hypothetical protein JET14_13375 [Martelella lutilitoris]|uniref:Uncharacterized protein n=1 Tax=Martelella lutilitoris TaxID=2583532 RepID=A0A7T7KK37_9HYPH|nr:hypothetical protein [Martelella lutilitoris]QQM29315.1 hypothetical protein JET14_13375 [Martelella lutilitoris]